MKKVLSILFLLALLVSVFAACGKDGKGGQVIFPLDSDPEYLDPQIASSPAERNVIANIFEGLVTYNETGEVVPAAAKEITRSEDGLTYTFHLKETMRWRVTELAKGVLGDAANDFDRQITAEDFAFGLRRTLSPVTMSPWAPSFLSIKNAPSVLAGDMKPSKLGIRVPDPFTLVLELSYPDDSLLQALTLPGAMPCDETYFKATGGRYGLAGTYLIYNGPFYLSNWNPGTALTARRNGVVNGVSYYDETDVYPGSVYFSINNEQQTRDSKLQNGTYEAAALTAVQAGALMQQKGIDVRAFGAATFCLLFNCKDETLRDNSIRRAIAGTFDLEAIQQSKDAAPADGIIPPACICGSRVYRDAVRPVKPELLTVKQAKSLMRDGMDRRNLKDVELTVLCTASNETAVRTAMQQWQSAFGVHFSITVEVLEDTVLSERIRTGNYQLAFAALAFDNSTAQQALERFRTGRSDNVVGLASKRYDALLDIVAQAKNQEDKLMAIRAAELFLTEQAVVLPISEAAIYVGLAKGVSGVAFTPTGDVLRFQHTLHR